MRKLIFFFFFLLTFSQAYSRDKKPKTAFDLDSSYISTYYDDLIVRIYSSNRNNFIQFSDLSLDNVHWKYRPNDYYEFGVGMNYKWFGLNVGTRLPALPKDDSKYGKTSKFGLQSYLYARKFSVDILAMKTHGYYLSSSNRDFGENASEGTYYKRRDLKTYNFGININYVLNNRKFSYKAAFKQNELQKMSAGSLIFGGGFYYLSVSADSAFIPEVVDPEYFKEWRNLDGFRYYTFNGNIGYAYTYVPHKNWIMTGSFRLSLGLQQDIWYFEDDDRDKQIKLSRSGVLRLSAGHHFPSFYLGVSYVHYQQNSLAESSSMQIMNGTNFTEFAISKRINLRKRKK